MNIIKFIIDFFNGIKSSKEQKRQALINKYAAMASDCNAANQSIKDLTSRNIYINYQIKNSWKKGNSELYDTIKRNKQYLKHNLSEDSVKSIESFKTNYNNFNNNCNDYNRNFIEYEKQAYKVLFDNVEGRALDDQQRECIVKEEINNLVVAGAGSGKTTTIVGKVKYLLKRYSYNPSELLVLSYTNASAKEMAERIKSETGENIDVMTFHKLGTEIIAEVEGKKRSLTKIKLNEYCNEKFNVLTKDSKYNELVCKYFISYLKPYKSRFDFKNEGEYIEYLRDTNIKSLKRDNVKSYEEMEIANYLFINNVSYIYEDKYKIDTRDRNHRQYEPDFYLPDYDIYIEHFGIDREGNVPDFFDGENGKTAKEKYNDEIKWKRETHKENSTTLIETYSYEKAEGVLTDNLKKKLENEGVKFNPMSRDEVWSLIEKQSDYEITGFVNLMGTFITHMKTNDYGIDEIKVRNNNYFNFLERLRNEAFIDLIAPIYLSYQKELEKSGNIDFDDMINLAIKYIREGKFNKKYSYIIVDEYQDISLTRYKLIKTIKDQYNSKLFCVGDDWQSIYKFAGSVIDLFTNFEKYYGYTEKSYIETTYRFNKSLIELSGRFVLKNKAQIKKQLRPFIEKDEKSFELVYGNGVEELSFHLKQRLNQLPKGSDVAFLGRYNESRDLVPFLDDDLTCNYYKQTDKTSIHFSQRKDLKIEYLTAHKSKGLQVDYVFLINTKNNRYGFPSQIEDDPILKIFFMDTEAYPFAEERRLFYVALTRAKKFVFLMVDNYHKSPFIREIEEDYGLNATKQNVQYCPKCKKGEMIIRPGKGKYPDFYGCSNYPFCKHRQKVF